MVDVRWVGLVLLGWLFTVAPAAHAGSRVALVIGNQRYDHTTNLEQAGTDAAQVARALRDLDFEVTELRDVGVQQMRKGLASFYESMDGADISFVYYAGHGIQLDGTNYLVPVDATLQAPTQASYQTVSTAELLGEMGVRRAGLNIVVLDACRNNPFARNWSGRTRGLDAAGLQAEEQVPAGFVVAHAGDSLSKAGPGKHLATPLPWRGPR